MAPERTRHLPLITNRIKFSLLRTESPFLDPLPLITPRINFGGALDLLNTDRQVHRHNIRFSPFSRGTSPRGMSPRSRHASPHLMSRANSINIAHDLHPAHEKPNTTNNAATRAQSAKHEPNAPSGSISQQANSRLTSSQDDSSDMETESNPSSRETPRDDREESIIPSGEATSDIPQASNEKISRPHGPPGKPHSGGYSVKAQLEQSGWNEGLYDAINAHVKMLAGTKLDERFCYQKQNLLSITTVCNNAREKYPILCKYDGEWPVHSMLQMHLKNTSAKYRQAQEQLEAQEKARELGKKQEKAKAKAKKSKSSSESKSKRGAAD